MSKTHDLKILPEHFWPVVNGEKTAEVRKNDRDFHCGDKVILYEWDGEYTGEATEREIIHVADIGSYLPGYVLLSLNHVASWNNADLIKPKDAQQVIVIDKYDAKISATYDAAGIYWCNHTGKALRNICLWTDMPD